MWNPFKKKSPKFILTEAYALDALGQAVHLKYNLYILAQTVLLSSFIQAGKSPDEALALTINTLNKLNQFNNTLQQ